MHRFIARRAFAVLVAAGVAALPGVGRAATLSGTVKNTAGSGISGMEARLWSQDDKGWLIAQTVLTDGTGSFTFTALSAGTYLVDARMPAGYSGNYGDRWYDVDPPMSDGYIGEDADRIVVADGDALTGYDITLEAFGGLDGQVLDPSGTPLTGARVRAEWTGDVRYHHNDVTQGPCCGTNPHWGRFYMRGLAPHPYRLIVYDPSGAYDTLVVPGPFDVTSGVNANAGVRSLTAAPADSAEPNGTAGTATEIDMSIIRSAQPWDSTGAAIYPRGDLDWYCLDALAGERLIVDVNTPLDVEGTVRPHPWLDPVVGFFGDGGVTLISQDDDSGEGYQSHLDTGELAAAGRYCFVVTTYGDTTFDGSGQQTAGAYALSVVMGNRRPTLSVSWDGAAAPVPPASITLQEGTTLTLDLAFSDPDGDPLTPTVAHLTASGDAVTTGTLTLQADTGTYTWDASQTAAQGSPYTLTFEASDGELAATVPVIVTVEGVNLPPTTPTPISPTDGEIVATTTPGLTVTNATDPDSDPLTYEYELYETLAATAPDQTASIAEDASGETTWTPDPIPENANAVWRVRAFDGNTDNGYSAWSEFFHFQVNLANDPPPAPTLVKPDEGAVVQTRTPTISATNVLDPEGQDVKLHLEVASDAAFTTLVDESPALDPAPGTTTAWTTTQTLDFDASYFARAWAEDSEGARSDYSNIHGFRIKPNSLPPTPTLGGTFAAGCTDQSFDTAPDSFTVDSDPDADGAALTIQLQVFHYEDAPASARPLLDETLPRDASGHTVFTADPSLFDAGRRYRVRARVNDGVEWTEWVECDFTLADGGTGGTDGGTGGETDGGTSGGDTDGGTGGTGAAKAGCGCSAQGDAGLMPAGLVLLLGVLLRRRRR